MTKCSVLFLLVLLHVLSANPTEAFRELSVEDEEILFHILSLKVSEIKSILEGGRKLLQITRQWQGSHAAESRLFQCVIRYCINTKIQGLVPANDGDDESRRGLSLPTSIQESPVNFSDTSQDITEILLNNVELLKADAVKHKKYGFKRRALKALYLGYIYLRDLLSRYKLLSCGFQYFTSKFWEWVDSAP